MTTLAVTNWCPKDVKDYLDEHSVCPSLDTWLSERLCASHQKLYSTLMQMRSLSENDPFPVDFDTLWPMLGYTRKDNAKRKLKTACSLDGEYKSLLHAEEHTPIRVATGGKLYLTLDAAQRFALMSQTAQGNEIAEFYVTTMRVIQEYHVLSLHYDKRQGMMEAAEEATLAFLEKNKKIVYVGDLGIIDNEHLIKVGSTNDGPTRIQTLKKAFPNGIRLVHIEEHPEFRELEARFKKHINVSCRQRNVTHLGKKYTECFAIDAQMTIDHYVKVIKQLCLTLVDHTQAGWSHDIRMKELEIEKAKLELEKGQQARVDEQPLRVKLELARMEHEQTMQMKLELARMEHTRTMRLLDIASNSADVGSRLDSLANGISAAIQACTERPSVNSHLSTVPLKRKYDDSETNVNAVVQDDGQDCSLLSWVKEHYETGDGFIVRNDMYKLYLETWKGRPRLPKDAFGSRLNKAFKTEIMTENGLVRNVIQGLCVKSN